MTWNGVFPISKTNEMDNMKKLMILMCVMGLTGCAHFTTTQTDVSYEEGKIVRSITTKATAITFVEAESQLANFKASQTDKTQSATVGSLNQSATSTNTLDSLTKLLQAAGALK